MIGMMLVTHGRLAEDSSTRWNTWSATRNAWRRSASDRTTTWNRRRKEIARAITAVDTGQGAIVLTDLFGGTPSNLAISLMRAGEVEVIAGINLPMLIRLAKARGCMGVVEAAKAARDAGRSYITVASEYLGQDA
jgi:PTS system mannose-specific IIA component